jgi:hypothetical protein
LGYTPKDGIYRTVYGLVPLTPAEQVTSGEDPDWMATLRWWTYAQVRYGAAALAVAAAIWLVKSTGVWFEPNQETEAFVVGVGFGFYWPRDGDIPLVVAAGFLVPLVYWVAARYAAEIPTGLLVKIGGVSKDDPLVNHNPNWVNATKKYTDHNEYPHHYAEMVAGAIFGGLFAASLI